MFEPSIAHDKGPGNGAFFVFLGPIRVVNRELEPAEDGLEEIER
jgi:hypothetical protein